MDASQVLAKLETERARTASRVDDLEREMREAGAAAAQASAALIEYERKGGSAARRRELEQTLAAAKAKAGEPWVERISGAQSGLRDCDKAIRQFVAEHLAELVEESEAAGRLVAEKINDLLAALVTACSEREQIEASLGQLAVKVAPLSPGDVSYSRATELAQAARVLLNGGGEKPVQLRRDREPWSRLLAQESPESEAVPA